MKIMPEYKYDVAISFLEQDEKLALEIEQLLKNELRVFVYSKKQQQLVGKDGEDELNRVFGSESRIVIILYRDGWGSTPWTRIEETAIRDRAYKDGYDFTTFVVLDVKALLPKWLPKTRIWLNFERHSIQGAASIIETRVIEAGGQLKIETLEEKARRMDQEVQIAQARKQFLNSDSGASAAAAEFKKVIQELEDRAKKLGELTTAFKCSFASDARTFGAWGGGHSLLVFWSASYINTLDHAALHIRVFKGIARFAGREGWDDPEELSDTKMSFDRLPNGEYRWRSEERQSNYYTNQSLADYAVSKFIDTIKEAQVSESRSN